MNETLTRTLTLNDAWGIAAVVDAASHRRQVARVIDGQVVKGDAYILRSTAEIPEGEDAFGGMIRHDDDIRDQYLSVHTAHGLVAWPIAELIEEHRLHTFMVIR